MKRFLRFLRPWIHGGCVMICLMTAVWIRQRSDFIPFVQIRIPPIQTGDMVLLASLSALIYIVIGFARGLYELRKPLHGYTSKSLVVWLYRSVAVAFLAFFGTGSVFNIFVDSISRLVLIRGCVLTLVVVTIVDMRLNSLNAMIERRRPYRVCALYTHQSFYDHVADNLSLYDIYQLDGVQYDATQPLAAQFSSFDAYDIVLLVGSYQTAQIQTISDSVRSSEKLFYHIPEGAFVDDLLYRPERFGPVMGFVYMPSPLEGWGRVIKRAGDIVFVVIFLLLFWWVYGLIALFIMMRDGRPVIYASQRVGKGGKPITVYKFRSMIKHADKQKTTLANDNERSGPLFKIANDPRIPPWGRRLRKLSLDELPQMRNILRGDMSLVGPRPHLPSEVANYTGWQKRLLSIKPGLTGYAQIFGRDKLSFDEEAKLDLYYIQNWHVFLDVYVVIATLKVVTKGS